MSAPLDGRVALVTGGAGSAVGRPTAFRLAQDGAAVVVAEIHAQRMADTVNEIRSRFGTRVLGIHMDIADREAVDAAVALAASELGPIDILINNPSENPMASLTEMSVDAWDRTIAVNLSAYWYLTRAVVPGMIDLRRGSIVNLSSPAGWRAGGTSGYGAYGLTKAAIHHMTATLGASLAPFGIRCNAIAAGIIRSKWTTSDEHIDGYTTMVAESPLGRMIEPEEIANLIAFLVSDQSEVVNGSIVDASGALMPRP